MVQAYYWFRPNQAYLQPTELVAQIKQTLQQQGIDYEGMLANAGDTAIASGVSAEQICVILGPGRLGLHHVQPDEGQIEGLLQRLAESAGESPTYIHNLLEIFADSELGNICLPDARCDLCQVSFCKRLRYR